MRASARRCAPRPQRSARRCNASFARCSTCKMTPIVINGELWRVVRVPAGDPRLIDGGGTERLATTDPVTRTINLNLSLRPPLLDRVMLHEVAHAVTISWGLLPDLFRAVSTRSQAGAEEWAAQLVENHAIEAVDAARMALGRPLCVRGLCVGRLGHD